jgi:hypothetical protein
MTKAWRKRSPAIAPRSPPRLRSASNIPIRPAYSRPFRPRCPNGIAYSIKGFTTPRSVGVNAGQTLFNGQQTVNQVRRAESQVSAARETLRVMERIRAALRGDGLHGRVARHRQS